MKREKLTSKLFSLSCENQKEILSKVIGLFTRTGYEIITLAQSQTDVADTVLITIEAKIPAQQVDNMLLRIRKVIGVIDVTIAFGSVLRSAMYRVSLTKNANAVWDIINKHNARGITLLEGNQLLVHQIGKAADIQRLFNELDGPQLLAFHHSPLTVNQPISVTEHENLSAGIFNKAVPSAAESAYAEIA
ncbi:hypothetical protein FPZ42_12050 [Mucilaginibacter achroorhodeus]|uniref:ACT domain-containing protein n=1 Tax=Mucilaginibacter achroorhodeus TaxID=2599294 RepID=A0A563U1A0_9SPHI|nr:acetolactate synthase small subunit [Mucilaginibacter achroorhodeus]TWR25333.1 hypothetical protein FPZ42_12050 [Mucilaginibacter achroorhodeus]